MELKDYQSKVVSDLDEFCNRYASTNDLGAAYKDFWSERGVTLNANSDNLCPYCDNLKGIPRVTIKVPTAGGKTFIAVNATKTILDHFPEGTPKVVAWFVPSDSILEQTYKNLCNPNHPYRQKLNVLFQSKVQISNKQQLLQGQGFNPQTISDTLTICVFSIQSFATRSKDGRLVYRENGALLPFEPLLREWGINFNEDEHPSLVDVMRYVQPVVIIDESHRFTSELNKEFFELLNPRFILNLTATPRKNSNIISFVSALKLKQNNMVKLPVVVYNLQEKSDVVKSALTFRNVLEKHAIKQHEDGGDYIRPIVLFQAETKTDKEERETFDKIKKMLISCQIPEEQIKIKTANINELKDVDLMSPNCPVRFIITINALKEGWDCPFAYILASLANKTSNIDVEQILGRILRQPYTRKHHSSLLNQSYVYSCSANFQATLDSIVRGLNGAGFTSKDYLVADPTIKPEAPAQTLQSQPNLFTQSLQPAEIPLPPKPETKPENTTVEDVNTSNVAAGVLKGAEDEDVKKQIQQAEDAARKAEELAKQDELSNPQGTPEEVTQKQMVNTVYIQDGLKDLAASIKLPQFFVEEANQGLFSDGEEYRLLEKEDLYEGFNLATQDQNIDLLTVFSNNIVAFDITDENAYVLKKVAVSTQQQKLLHETFAMWDKTPKGNNLACQVAGDLRIDDISEPQVTTYIRDILTKGNYTDEQLLCFSDNPTNITIALKNKIKGLLAAYASNQFTQLLNTGRVKLMPSFAFHESLIFEDKDDSFPKTLYTAEKKDMNRFEYSVAMYVSQLPNVVFWHRNLERGYGFNINGFINHYPDFIILTEKGNIVLVETKGAQLANADSKDKLYLGQKWADKAGDKFHYFMVFENDGFENSLSLADFIGILKQL